MTKKFKDALPGWTFLLHRLLRFSVAFVFGVVFASAGSLDVSSARAEAGTSLALTNSIRDDKSAAGESRFTTLDGARIHYVNYGKGSEALVLIHGWTCNLDNWRDQIPDLAKRNRVIAIDLPGHGQSDKPQKFPTAWIFSRARLKPSCTMLK
jgi:hypothetical protein